jgi:uroporphyrinogen decarboxylase
VAFNAGPMFSPSFYRQHILPKEKAITGSFSKPLITHSDGNMTPLLDDWLELGQQAIHPLQPDVMDIRHVKRQYGHRVALVGNVAMSHLVQNAPAEVEAEVRDLILSIGAGGGYLLSSSNSLTDDMQPGSVLAIRDALRKYGRTLLPSPVVHRTPR